MGSRTIDGEVEPVHVRIPMMMRGTQVSKKKWDRRGCARHMGSASSVCGVVGLRFRARQKKVPYPTVILTV